MQASFANGVATFNLESLKVKIELLNKFIAHLGDFKTALTKENILDYSLLPAGTAPLLHMPDMSPSLTQHCLEIHAFSAHYHCSRYRRTPAMF